MQSQNGGEKIFFRALPSQDHIVDYNSGIRNSYHTSVPGVWIDIWYKEGERDPTKYPLDIHGWGKFTNNALHRFMDLAENKYSKMSDPWSPMDLKACSELDGWCAFTEPQEALLYGCQTMLGKQTGLDKYVSFSGEFNGIIPEGFEGSGILVKVSNVLKLYTRIEFITEYNLDSSACP